MQKPTPQGRNLPTKNLRTVAIIGDKAIKMWEAAEAATPPPPEETLPARQEADESDHQKQIADIHGKMASD